MKTTRRHYFTAETEFGFAVGYQHAALGLCLECEGTEEQCRREAQRLNREAEQRESNQRYIDKYNAKNANEKRRAVRYFEPDLMA